MHSKIESLCSGSEFEEIDEAIFVDVIINVLCLSVI
jgi:hypothetical protein